jgi:mono/diheme cytochrome c family protein
MKTIAKGQAIFHSNACWGCHKVEGLSNGNVGPELTNEGNIARYEWIEHQLWDPRYKVNNCVMPYFFSKKIVKETDPKTHATSLWYETSYGDLRPLSELTRADIEEPEINASLDVHGFFPDAASQETITDLVTFILAQTGTSYTEAQSERVARLAQFDASVPPDVHVTMTMGKTLFEQSGCLACHWLGDADNPKNPADNMPGGGVAPNLSWEGSRHSPQWIDAHYVNPQAFVPKSIMPVFPLSNSQRAALTLYDASHIPTGGHPVSSDQDMTPSRLQNSQIKTNPVEIPAVRYMVR